jgi:hypothetical protein
MTKAKHTPAHARPADADDDVSDLGDGAGRPGSPLATALRDLAPPRHGSEFWTDLDRRLADEPQLRLAPRSAIRPITQPPPVIGDAKMARSLKGTDIPSPPGPSSRRPILLVALAIVVLLVVVAALQSPDDDAETGGDDAPTEAADGRTPTSDDEAAAPATTAPPPTQPPGTIDPTAPMAPGGVGPLVVGASLADHQALGMTIQVDDSMFRGSGGRCYEARVQGALDLRLRFRSPDGRRSDDPGRGVLTAVSIESGLPTSRASDTGVGLGAPQDQVLAAYGGNLDDRAHPFVSGGHIFRADAGNGTGIAFLTDGTTVIGISVGEMDAIRFINECG